MSAPAFRLGYRPALDGVRGVAIIAVMLFHGLAQLGWFPGGYLGVDVFFVLSGFLITTLLLEEHAAHGRIDLGRFFARRALRLLPALLLLLTVAALLALLADFAVWAPDQRIYDAGVNDAGTPLLTRWQAIGAALISVGNWTAANGYDSGSLGVVWSLAIEDQFYLIWPALLVVLLARGASSRLLLAVAGGGIAASAGLRLALYLGGAPFGRLFHGTDTRADALLVGCTLAILATGNRLPTTGSARRILGGAELLSATALGGLILIGPRPWDAPWLPLGGFTVIALATACGLAYLLVAPQSHAARALSWRPLVATGRLSYGLNLWHGTVYWYVGWGMLGVLAPLTALGPLGFYGVPLLVAGLCIGPTVLIARRSYYKWEIRFLRLKDRFRVGGAEICAPLPAVAVGD